ncbi:MAG: cell division protein FtsH, partial [Ktedonobacteraceae bacterium]|nr:cell division protein FtsH [Ktedonobacteraceae bacterium]
QRIVGSCYGQAIDLLATHRPTLDRMAQELRRHETIDSKQLISILEETGVPVPAAQLQSGQKGGVTLAPPPPKNEPAQPPEVE